MIVNTAVISNKRRKGVQSSFEGDPAKGRPHRFTLPFPAELLRAGDNDIQITTTEGSWMLYDSLALTTPAGAELQPAYSRTVVGRVQAIPALCEAGGQHDPPGSSGEP